jgi:hypothetical protein
MKMIMYKALNKELEQPRARELMAGATGLGNSHRRNEAHRKKTNNRSSGKIRDSWRSFAAT